MRFEDQVASSRNYWLQKDGHEVDQRGTTITGDQNESPERMVINTESGRFYISNEILDQRAFVGPAIMVHKK
jgi:hypothetical protein